MDHHRGTGSISTPAERCFGDGRSFVTLTEALTWIAFGVALSPDDLRTQVGGDHPPSTDSPVERMHKFFSGREEDMSGVPGKGYFEDRQRGLRKLTVAWRQLRDAVDRGTVKVRGRLTSEYTIGDAQLANVEELPGDVLATYMQFDVSTGGIRRKPQGSPEILWQDDSYSFDREFEAFGADVRAGDGYLMVEVGSDALLRLFPKTASKMAVASKAGAENECRVWLTSEFAADPDRKRTKADFSKAALARFSGRLSARGFIRAWDAVASEGGRSLPGRKS